MSASERMYCPNCSATVEPDASSCSSCSATFGTGAAWAPRTTPAPDAPLTSTHGWRWLLAGALYGVVMRALTGILPAGFHGAMSLTFLVGTPLVVGALAVYGIRSAQPSVPRMLSTPFAPTALMLFGTAVTLMEGSICLAIMAPLVFLEASIGGLCMGLALRTWRVKKSGIGTLALMPFLLLGHDQMPLQDTFHELRESTIVGAAPEVVWSRIVLAKNIKGDELPLSLVHMIGVPKPIEAVNTTTPDGEVRLSQWEKGVRFSARVVERRDFQTITWRYSFDRNSFPPGTMDEHVVIGGKYLDLGDTTFNLHPISGGGTRLEVVARYRLTTSVNIYADPVARLLGHDFLRMLLGLYKSRSERAGAAH